MRDRNEDTHARDFFIRAMSRPAAWFAVSSVMWAVWMIPPVWMLAGRP